MSLRIFLQIVVVVVGDTFAGQFRVRWAGLQFPRVYYSGHTKMTEICSGRVYNMGGLLQAARENKRGTLENSGAKTRFCSISGAYFFPVLIYFRCLFLLRATLDSGGRPPRAATPNRLNVICVDLMNYRCLFIFRAYFFPVLILISSHPRFWRGPDGLDFRAYFFPVLISFRCLFSRAACSGLAVYSPSSLLT